MLFKGNKNKGEKATKKAGKIYSIDEVVKAGGADKFARKIGHTPLVKRNDIPAVDLTDEEMEEALIIGRRK